MPDVRPNLSRNIPAVYSGPAPTREHASVAVAQSGREADDHALGVSIPSPITSDIFGSVQ
jgi:hypothetical protein